VGGHAGAEVVATGTPEEIAAEVARRTKTLMRQAEIGVKAGRLLIRCKVAKHFTLKIYTFVFFC
jgi:hypothetical protein